MSLFADDCVFESPRGPDPWGRRFEGRDAVREGSGSLHDDSGRALRRRRHFVAGERGVSEWTLTGTTVDGGSRRRGCDIWTFRGDDVRQELVLEDRRAVKLVTFGYGDQVGYLDGEEIVVLDAPSMRELFEDGGADETGERDRARGHEAARADRPEEVLPHGRQLPRARGGVEAGRLVARDRTVDRLLPERRRDRRPGRAGRLPRAPHRGARLRARARRRDATGGQVVLAGGGDRLHRRLRDLQRHHRARHPAARDALGRLQLLQGDRHVLPARAVDRHAGRDPEPARPRDGAARQRRGAPDLALEPHERDDPGDPQPLLGARLLGRRRRLDRDRVRRRRLLARRGVALPQARRRHGVRDRADRRAAQPGVSWQEAHGEPAPPRVRW